MAAIEVSQVQLSPDHLGLLGIDNLPPGSIEAANELLQQNHDKWHMYFQDIAGHNHISHAILTVLAMGGGPEQLKRAYDDGEVLQRPLPPLIKQTVENLSDPEKFLASMLKLPEYTNFLVFFEQEIKIKGWKTVVSEYCFSRTPVAEAMFSQLFEGLYHPIIHLGFGIEFDQPSIVAEGLAQAASHHPAHVWTPFFQRSEQLAQSVPVKSKPLIELYAEVRANQKIRGAARIQDGPFRGSGILERAVDELVHIAAKFQVSSSDLERATAEVISCSAFTNTAQKDGYVRKIDFFYLHMVTSGLFIHVLMQEPWIKIEDKVRLLEWKGRIDLTWYAANGSPELRAENILEYNATLSSGLDWDGLYKVANKVHDDGHIVKFIRALKDGEDVIKPFEQNQAAASSFPVAGNMWFKMAQICYDSTANIVDEPNRQVSKKWVFGAGFDPAWREFQDVHY